MADFCRQCSLELFGEDFGDLANIAPMNGAPVLVLCEGCETLNIYTFVNYRGECVDPTCRKHYGQSASR